MRKKVNTGEGNTLKEKETENWAKALMAYARTKGKREFRNRSLYLCR